MSGFNYEKMYTYLKGFAMGKGLPETVKALTFSRRLHSGQSRKSGEPYIIHPLTMACHAISMGLCDDSIIATILLHDIVEDCGLSVNDLPVREDIRLAVGLLSFKKPVKFEERDGEGPRLVKVKSDYYSKISENKIASVVKIIDRCHNVSSMAGTFTKEKLNEYIEETDMFVLPLLREAKENFPEYQDNLFVLKYHINSVTNAIRGTIETYSEGK